MAKILRLSFYATMDLATATVLNGIERAEAVKFWFDHSKFKFLEHIFKKCALLI
jgi:hypothetical protein